MHSTEPTKNFCAELLYSVILINAALSSLIFLPPRAKLISITEIVVHEYEQYLLLVY